MHSRRVLQNRASKEDRLGPTQALEDLLFSLGLVSLPLAAVLLGGSYLRPSLDLHRVAEFSSCKLTSRVFSVTVLQWRHFLEPSKEAAIHIFGVIRVRCFLIPSPLRISQNCIVFSMSSHVFSRLGSEEMLSKAISSIMFMSTRWCRRPGIDQRAWPRLGLVRNHVDNL